MSSHSSLPHDLRKKPLEHPPRDGSAGMGFSTKRHLVDVKARMARYAEEQDQWGYDESQNHDFDDMRDRAKKGHHSSSSSHHKSTTESTKHNHGHGKTLGSPAVHQHHSSSSSSHDLNRKGLERPPRDGMTGMGPQTKRHFVEVKARMERYCDDQDVNRYDRQREHRPSNSGVMGIIDRIFGAEKGIQGQGSPHSSHTPTTARKRSDHLNLATPPVTRRERKAASVSEMS